MKLSSLIFVSTLALNFTLLGVIAIGALTHFAPAPSPAPAPPPQRINASPDPDVAIWSHLQASDLIEEGKRLAAEGFPPAAIRAIVTAQIRETFAARRKALESAKSAAPFWKNTAYDPAMQAAFRALSRDEQKAVNAVLGPDLNGPNAEFLRRNLINVSEEKIVQLAAIRDLYHDERQAIYDLQRGMTTPDDREKLARLEQAMHAEFAGVLTASELEDYDLRTSSVAGSLRYSLGTFVLNEAEFREVYRLKADFEARFPSWASTNSNSFQLRSDAQKVLDGQIAAALGPARDAEYRQATDYGFKQTSQLMSRLGYPPATASTLYALKREFEPRRDAIFSSLGSREAKAQQLADLRGEATARVGSILGGNAAAMDLYKQYGGSWWRYLAP